MNLYEFTNSLLIPERKKFAACAKKKNTPQHRKMLDELVQRVTERQNRQNDPIDVERVLTEFKKRYREVAPILKIGKRIDKEPKIKKVNIVPTIIGLSLLYFATLIAVPYAMMNGDLLFQVQPNLSKWYGITLMVLSAISWVVIVAVYKHREDIHKGFAFVIPIVYYLVLNLSPLYENFNLTCLVYFLIGASSGLIYGCIFVPNSSGLKGIIPFAFAALFGLLLNTGMSIKDLDLITTLRNLPYMGVCLLGFFATLLPMMPISSISYISYRRAGNSAIFRGLKFLLVGFSATIAVVYLQAILKII